MTMLIAFAIGLIVAPAVADPTGIDPDCWTRTVSADATITLTGPATSPEGRSITWSWIPPAGVTLYKADGSALGATDYDDRSITFVAPPPGTYKISLGVADTVFSSACVDQRCIVITVSSYCPLCSKTFCEKAAIQGDDGTGLCSDTNPTVFTYPGTGAGLAFKWWFDGTALTAATNSLTIDWSTPDSGSITNPVGVGDLTTGIIPCSATAHTVGFAVYAVGQTAPSDPQCTGSFTKVCDPIASIT